jgi:hypothetical protein
MGSALARAAILLRPGSHYRADAFADGLRRHGFEIVERPHRSPRPQDLLVIWNRGRGNEPVADSYERAGARVLVAENGYIARHGGSKFYALALGHHNGAGRWYVGERPRFPIPDHPWRESGRHVLVLPQRGIGERGIAMPSTWQQRVLARLQKMTDRPVLVRPHPGHRRVSRNIALEDQLAGAHCAVTWGSGAGIRALQLGIPVFHEFSRWIGASAAARLDGQIEACNTPDRELLWTRISWSQWTLGEVQTGEAFDALLDASGDLLCPREQPVGDHRAGDDAGRGPALLVNL